MKSQISSKLAHNDFKSQCPIHRHLLPNFVGKFLENLCRNLSSRSLSLTPNFRWIFARPRTCLTIVSPGYIRTRQSWKPASRWNLGFGACLVWILSLEFIFPCFAQDKVTYQDHILPLIEANCSKCHNSDKKKADLDLTSYQGALKGSGSGTVLLSGNVDGSKLWKAVNHSEEPFMPPNRPKLGDKELDLIKKWITGGLLENAGAKAIAAAKPSVDLTLQADAIGKPDGPPPMPERPLPVTPVVHTTHLNAITGLACSPWAPLIAVAGQKQVLLFNTDTLQPVGILPYTEGQPVDVKFSQNGKLLLASGGRGANSGRVVVWHVLTGERLMILGNEYDTVLAADIRPDQSQVALGGPSRLVKIYSTKKSEQQHKIKKHTEWVSAVAFRPNGQMLATADRNGGISIWDPDNAQELFTLGGHKSAVTALSWRGDSKLLASSSEDGAVKLWELKEGKQTKNWNAHGSGAMCVSYSHDGRLVSCGRDNVVTLWNGSGGKERNMDGSCDLALRSAFSYDGKRIFSSDFSGHVFAWNAADGKRAGELNTNPGAKSVQVAGRR
jgi:WD40 repeat protein